MRRMDWTTTARHDSTYVRAWATDREQKADEWIISLILWKNAEFKVDNFSTVSRRVKLAPLGGVLSASDITIIFMIRRVRNKHSCCRCLSTEALDF